MAPITPMAGNIPLAAQLAIEALRQKSAGISAPVIQEETKKKKVVPAQNRNHLGPGMGPSIALAERIGTMSPQTGGLVGVATRAAGVTQPVASAASAGGSGGFSVQDYIDQLNAARRAATIAALDKSRQNALSNLASERSAIQPRYYDARNQVAARSQQNARSFAEFMATRGSTKAGSNAQATIAQNMRTQGDLGTLGRQEAQAYTDIERRRSDVNNAYESDVAAANAGIEADRMRALLDQYNTDRGYELDLAGLSGQLPTGGQTLDARRFDSDLSRDNRDFNYKLGRDNVLDSRYNNEFDYQKSRDDRNFDFQKAQQDFENTFRQGQFDYQKASDLWERTFKEKSFDQDVRQFSAQLGADYDRLNQAQQQFVAEMAYKNKAQQLDREKFDADQTYRGDALQLDRDKLALEASKAAAEPEPSASQAKNNVTAQAVAQLDTMDADERAAFFEGEKQNLIKSLGLSGYNSLFNMYYDKFGNPIER